MERQYLLGALEYTEKLLSLGEKTVLDIQADSIACFLEGDFVGREGVSLNTDDGDVWLRMKRLRETNPPQHHLMFEGWVSGSLANPDKPPQLNSERLVRLSKEEISELIDADRLSQDDVMEPLKVDPDGKLDALLRLSSFPEFQASWQIYIESHWNKWAELERPRRRSIALYSKLYQLHQRIISLGEDNPIELVWGIGIALWQRETARIFCHIIEQLIESDLEMDGTIVLRPRTVPPSINLKPFHALEIEGSEAVQRETTSILAQIRETETGLSPFESATFHRILQTCASRLAAKGRYYPDERKDPSDRTLPTAEAELLITDTWLIFARTRTADIRRDDLKRFIQKVEELTSDNDIPDSIRAFVRPPSNKTIYGQEIDLENTDLDLPDTAIGGKNPSVGDTRTVLDPSVRKSHTFFFPLPYNEEQISIAKSLEEHHGVVVQGPPGTGKTHTIANIISHYLALGRSVLVTAKTAEALTAVQEKLPEGIRNLAISVIHNDQEGAHQLETAMKMLSNEAKQIDVLQTNLERIGKQKRIADIISRLEKITKELQDHARLNLSRVMYRAHEWMPMDLAREIAAARASHEWFQDRPSGRLEDPCPISAADVKRVADLRHSLGDDLAYRTDELPSVELLPGLGTLVAAHEKLIEIERIENEIRSGAVPLMELPSDEDLADVADLISYLKKLDALHRGMSKSEWFKSFVTVALAYVRESNLKAQEVFQLMERWTTLGQQGKAFIRRQVAFGDVHPLDEEVTVAVGALSTGKNPFGFIPIGKSALKSKLAQIQIEGRAPQTRDDWTFAAESRKWFAEVDEYRLMWHNFAANSRLPPHHTHWSKAGRFIVLIAEQMSNGHAVLSELGKYKRVSEKLAPYGFDWDEVFDRGNTDQFLRALHVNIRRRAKVDAEQIREDLKTLVQNPLLPFDEELSRVIVLLGKETISVHDLARVWEMILAEADRLAKLRPQLEELDALVAKIHAADAPKWAKLLRTVPSGREKGPMLPPNWRDSWDWAKRKVL
jgi:Cdc6-like AAA superfamily ATPase